MRLRAKVVIFSSVAVGLWIMPRAGRSFPAAEWTSLLDADLSQWESYLSYRHKPDYDGAAPTDDNGKPLSPIGYNNDTVGVFTVVMEGGEPVLRVSGEVYGSLFTKREYGNYRLRLKVKWGEKKWVPRLDKLRDSGLLYHSIGENGVDYWRSWKLSQEFQIMEGHMGDYWAVANSAIDVRAFLPEGQMNSVASEKQPFLPFGAGSPYGGFCLRSEDRESPHGEWTELELVCFEGKSLHMVNGQVVMALSGSRYLEDGKAFPLKRGKIQLQSEAATVFFKDIQIREIDTLPQQFAAYFPTGTR